ncbi:hypothetical protein [Bosea sp. (in: a-proteobacteria)]|uniref:hypothetical protein n=1 Tax=Bosea sp. (in: a-proteobacteria) TaxID=1871050 RepID=UPI0025C7346C|nr:hypothetical protein [Bosea sp. (in: a-proteobacteria)]
MTARSNQPGVRNPLLLLPAASALAALPTPAREALRGVLEGIRDDAAQRAQKSWRTHKAPMALY